MSDNTVSQSALVGSTKFKRRRSHSVRVYSFFTAHPESRLARTESSTLKGLYLVFAAQYPSFSHSGAGRATLWPICEGFRRYCLMVFVGGARSPRIGANMIINHAVILITAGRTQCAMRTSATTLCRNPIIRLTDTECTSASHKVLPSSII